jgi:hypothetical protein
MLNVCRARGVDVDRIEVYSGHGSLLANVSGRYNLGLFLRFQTFPRAFYVGKPTELIAHDAFGDVLL